MNIGEKIKSLRLQNNLTQEDLANRTELSKGFISQLENDLTSPSIATLMDILTGLGTDLQSFFSEAKDTQIVFTKNDYFENVSEEQKLTMKWLVPNAQKNMMEPTLIALAAGGSTIKDQPHDGEEFGYVLKGAITLYVGKKKYEVKKGESFYYECDQPHYIANESNSSSELLWVSSPPNF
ncbi:MAG: helix-turn-helix transcriptional regulator [Clostridia bacterium]|nr:helix-turn-helix transcriptional regulator [Clostridia bacterium]